MATATLSPPEDLADLLHRLGDIAPGRIRMQPPLGTATEDDVVAARESSRKRRCELIDGILVEKQMGFAESLLAAAVAAILREFVHSRNLGLVAGADGMVRLWPGRVRIPDAAYLSWDRLPERRVPREPIQQVSPDLAVEVLSDSNTTAEMSLKRKDYFRSGVKIVWEIDPPTRSVNVYSDPDTFVTLTEVDSLSGEDVLPGLSIPVREIFAELERHG